MPSVKANHDIDRIRCLPVAHRRCRQQITKSAEIRHGGNYGDARFSSRFVEEFQRFRNAQLLSSHINVMDTSAQRCTNDGVSSVDKRTSTIDDGLPSAKRFVK